MRLCWKMTMIKKMMTEALLKEWCYELNSGVDPKDLKRSSQYDAWWKCSKCKGIWQSKVKNRTNGSGCPFCTGRMVLRGFNDLETLYPHLAKQWLSSEHNKHPWEVTKGSHEKVVWECERGHRWTAEVKSRVVGNDCPYCSGRFAITGENDLATLHPELMDEWHWEKNKGIEPSTVAEKSNTKYWWKCSLCGYEWSASPAHRTRSDRMHKSGCPRCIRKVIWDISPGENHASAYKPELEKEWDPMLNDGKKLNEYFPGSNKYGIWTCHKYGLTWKAQINSRVMNGKGCPYCSGKRAVPGYTDLQTVRPDIAREWHPQKNGNLMPDQFTPYSSKRIWWICEKCGYEWPAKIANRSLGRGCPHCAPNRPD